MVASAVVWDRRASVSTVRVCPPLNKDEDSKMSSIPTNPEAMLNKLIQEQAATEVRGYKKSSHENAHDFNMVVLSALANNSKKA